MCDLLVIPFSSDSEELPLVPASVLVCDSLVIFSLDSGELSLVPAAGPLILGNDFLALGSGHYH